MGIHRCAVKASAAIAVAAWIAGCRPTEPPPPTEVVTIHPSLAGVTVVLDPGHGGEDTGAVRAGVCEATVNYRMASTLANVLRARGASVVFTVTSDTLGGAADPRANEPPLVRPRDARLVWNGMPVRLRPDSSPDDLYRRAAIVRRCLSERTPSGPILFLALHCDELGHNKGRGARVYFDRRSGSPCRLALILKRRLTDAGLTNSPGGRVIPRAYGVLNPHYNVATECVLVEMATLSDARDRNSVKQRSWRLRLATLLADGITECCDSRTSPERIATAS